MQAYARAEHISPTEAAVKFIQDGLEGKRAKTPQKQLTEAQLEQLRNSPTVVFFGGLSRGVDEANGSCE